MTTRAPRRRQPGDRLFDHTTTRYSKTYRPGDRGFNVALGVMIAWFVLWFSLVIGGLAVAIHFILKYW